ncbi:hypothetical protein [Methylocapsa acidiphila]|uniref:hypothetical protein n=1 Tax=Methylocapsa acidiphila TaxID=133552 RepID=UPI0003FAC15F|nr:hypothetical protein [Methylocapsa acidiphila]
MDFGRGLISSLRLSSFVLIAAFSGGAAPSPAAPSSGGACIWALGDSLTLGYQVELAKILPDRRVVGGGFGAQTSTQIAARAGAIKTHATIAGGRISATGPSTVTTIAPRVISSSAKSDEIAGALAGRPGKLTRDAADSYLFWPAPMESDSEAPPNSDFIPDTRDARDCVLILWAGQNNMPALAQVLADTDAILAPYVRGKKPFLVIGALNSEREIDGSPMFRLKMQLSQTLAQRYGNNYIDIRGYLVSRALQDLNLPADPGDQADVANGVVPRALRRDGLHPNESGNRAIARYLAAAIKERGW